MKQKLAFKATKLTKKQKVFVAEYQVDLNGTQAAIRAGYSPKTAEVIANQLFKKTWVSEAIKKQMEERLHQVRKGGQLEEASENI